MTLTEEAKIERETELKKMAIEKAKIYLESLKVVKKKVEFLESMLTALDSMDTEIRDLVPSPEGMFQFDSNGNRRF